MSNEKHQPCTHERKQTYPNFFNAIEVVTGQTHPKEYAVCLDCGETLSPKGTEVVQ